jgi:8-hydroxy-5-deazaflavin:NADPH oxidoreductase
MNIGILGTGNMARGLAKLWVKKEHKILFGSRDPKRAQELAASIGPLCSAGSYADAAKFGDVVLVATKWTDTLEAVKAAGSLAGKTVIDCTNPLSANFMELVVGHTSSAAEEIAKVAAGAKVVKAFNTVFSPVLEGDHNFNGYVPSVFLCGDDADAKTVVAGLAKDAGLGAVDAGPLKNARYAEPMCVMMIHLAYEVGMGTNLGLVLMKK